MCSDASAPLSSELHRRLVELCPDAIVLLQGDRYVFCNQRFYQMFGYTPQDVRDGLSFLQLVREEDFEAVRERYAKRLRGANPPPRFRLQLLRKDGTAIECETSAALVMHEGQPADLVIMRDVSDDEQARAALRASREAARRAEKRFRVAFEASPDAITVSDLSDGRIVAINDSALRLIGYRRDEVIGVTTEALGVLDAETRRQFVAVLERDGALDNFEIQFRNKSGERRVVQLSARLTGAGGEDSVLTFGHDVTQRVNDERALRRLAQVNRALTSRLFTVQEGERVEIARELHDRVGQALAVLKMESEWITSHADQVDEVQAAGRRLMKLVDDVLLVVRRLARGLRPDLLDDLGLAPALSSMVDEVAVRSPVALEARLTDLPQLRREAATALFRIAQEALSNVLRHASAQRCRLTLVSDGDDTVLSIEDDGVGIATDDNDDAICLGLAGMRERAELLGGTLEVGASDLGGTLVRARVPTREHLAREAAPDRMREPS